MGDFQTDIHASMPQLHKNFNFQLPFYGFRFNYTRVCNTFYASNEHPMDKKKTKTGRQKKYSFIIL